MKQASSEQSSVQELQSDIATVVVRDPPKQGQAGAQVFRTKRFRVAGIVGAIMRVGGKRKAASNRPARRKLGGNGN